MKNYIETLKSAASAQEELREQSKLKLHRGRDSRIVCDKPLAKQIEELMRSLPPLELQRRWTMAEFVARLSGRFGARPHAMQVGDALRGLGWVQSRDWTKEGSGRRYWKLLPYEELR